MRLGLSTAAYYGRLETEDAALAIARLPVDCAEVVRCRDCEEADDEWEYDDGSRFHLCNRYDWAVVRANDFCSYGKRRAENG